MDAQDCFAARYQSARGRFLTAAAEAGAVADSHVHPEFRGAEGEALAIDTALCGPRAARDLLIVTSGTHGVEGFCGSGCQIALLRDAAFLRRAAEAGIAVLFMHAVNPYGFSHLRRVNEDNVDLNRNFQDFSVPPPVNAAYAELHDALLPKAWPPPAESERVIGEYIARHGQAALQAAVSAGQYAFPNGMFYGGQRPAWSNERVRALLRAHAASRRRLAWIDLHSGLGPPGRGERIYAGPDDPVAIARAQRCWGEAMTSSYEGSSTSAEVRGLMGLAAQDECPGVECTGIVLEFGTVPLLQVFGALRADHWLHRHPEARASHGRAIGAAMRAAFFVEDPAWQAAVLAQSLDAARAAVEHMARSSGT